MPTGYTAAVGDGEVTDFAVFAKRCARAFGALMSMRDAPEDAPIPPVFEPDTRLADKHIEEAKRTLTEAASRTEAQWLVEAAEVDQKILTHWRESEAKRLLVANRYQSMLDKVRAWNPPTDEHVGLKEFMIEQLEKSILFDCSPSDFNPEPYGDNWHRLRDETIERAAKELAHYEKSRQEEIDRAAGRTKWVQDLFTSLESVDA